MSARLVNRPVGLTALRSVRRAIALGVQPHVKEANIKFLCWFGLHLTCKLGAKSLEFCEKPKLANRNSFVLCKSVREGEKLFALDIITFKTIIVN